MDTKCQTCSEETAPSETNGALHQWSNNAICFEKGTNATWRTETHYYLASPPGQPIRRKRLSSC